MRLSSASYVFASTEHAHQRIPSIPLHHIHVAAGHVYMSGVGKQ